MSVYAISDLHLSLNSDKSMEVFSGWKGYVDKIKNNWNEKIVDEDTVIIIGDISWAMTLEEAQKDLKFVNDLPGRKILIKGNHDYWWSTKAKINNFLKENRLDKIDIVYNSAYKAENISVCGTRGWLYNSPEQEDQKILARELGRLQKSLDCAADFGLPPVVFLHYPPVYGIQESEKIINVLIERNVKRCYYGHIHGSEAKKGIIEGVYKGIEFHLVSCDYVNFFPVRIC